MLGVAGIVAPEVLGGAGIIPADTGLVWFKSGAIPPRARSTTGRIPPPSSG